MKTHPLAKRYARALFDLADQQNILDQVKEEVQSFRKLLDSEKRLRVFLLTPEISRQQKLDVVKELFKDKVSGVYLNFLLLLVRKGRQNFYSEIDYEFNNLYDKKLNRLRATVTTVLPLEKVQLDELTTMLAKSLNADILLENKVEPEILGGMIVQAEGKVFDSSMLNQLKKLHARLRATKTAV